MTLKEQEVREAIYRAALQQMALENTSNYSMSDHEYSCPRHQRFSEIWDPVHPLPRCTCAVEPNYATVKADLK